MLALGLTTACNGPGTDGGKDGTDAASTDTDAASTDTDAASTDTEVPLASPWSLATTPCNGSRVDALLCDDADTCYVGCGQNADSDGLFVTTDAGQSWSAPVDAAGGYFATMRVNHLSRDDDGLLYVAGTGDNAYRVVSLDTQTGELIAVYTNGSNVNYSFTAGSFATNGRTMVTESLTGTGIVVKQVDDAAWASDWADTDGWASGYGWWLQSGAADHVQVLDMTVVDGEILGVGSTINYPPVVYLPPQSWDFGSYVGGDHADRLWDAVILNEEDFSPFIGECWGIDGNSDGLAVACVDQADDRAMVYTIGSDWKTSAYMPSAWTATDLSTVLTVADPAGLDHSTWTRQVCRGPDNLVVAVGADTQSNTGWLATSSDGGTTWADHTEDIVVAHAGSAFPVLFQCQVIDAHVVAAGAGFLAKIAIEDL
jgi:hypothetical protein